LTGLEAISTWSSSDDDALIGHLARERVVDSYSRYLEIEDEKLERKALAKLFEEERQTLHESSAVNASHALDDLRVGTTVELHCPHCEAPIMAMLTEREVVNMQTSPQARHHYEIRSKPCDCPIVIMYSSSLDFFRKRF
jgi:hypothetical protein